MAGHSKWANIKHKKAREDAKRGKIFTKLIREITVAAREGGGDIDYNPRLRLAVDKANAANMPKDNIERAILRGTGELEGVNYEEYTYEGYGPEGVAVFIEVVTDNKNRTVPELRHLFTKHNGNLGEDGCVAWQFERKGLIQLDGASVEDEDTLLLEAIEAGAQEMEATTDDEGNPIWDIYTDPTDLHQVHQALSDAGYKVIESTLTRIATSTVDLDADGAKKILNFYEALDDHDDVQNVYANFEIADDILAQLD